MTPKLLTGFFTHAMDAKGRVKLPAMWEGVLGKSFMLTRGTGNMLYVFTMEQWEKFTEYLMSMPMLDLDAQELRRKFGGAAWPCETDKQGRFLIPQQLRKIANLQKDIVLNGALSWGEIWDAEAWERHDAEHFDVTDNRLLQMMHETSGSKQ